MSPVCVYSTHDIHTPNWKVGKLDCLMALCFLQGNCQVCRVPKLQLDDLELKFMPRQKEPMLRDVHQAVCKGIFPGWKQDRIKVLARKGKDTSGPIHPQPLLKSNGQLVLQRTRVAQGRLGRHMKVLFFDDLHGVDLHPSVSSVNYVQAMYCNCLPDQFEHVNVSHD